MAVKFIFEDLSGTQTTCVCSALGSEQAHRMLTGAHYSEAGTFILNHDDGTDIFTLNKYKRVSFREVKQ